MNKRTVSAQKISLILLSIIWLTGGCILLTGGLFILIAEGFKTNPFIYWLGIILSIILGVVKAQTVFKKISRQNIAKSQEVKNDFFGYFFGWIQVLGLKKIGLILLMIVLGILLAKILPDFYRSLIRIAVGIALVSGAFDYLMAIKNS